jgi:hypothetical protein
MRVRSQITMQAANIGMENPGQATLGEVAEYTAILYNEQKKRNDAEYQRWQTRNAREDEKWKVDQKGLALEGAAYDFQLKINEKYKNNIELTSEDVHMASYYGIPLPGVPGVYAEATPGSVLKTAREGDSKWLRFESPASGSGNNLTEAERKAYAGNAFDLIYDHGYLRNSESLGQDKVRDMVDAYFEDGDVLEEEKYAVRQLIAATGGMPMFVAYGPFATPGTAVGGMRVKSDEALHKRINDLAGGKQISKEAYYRLVGEFTKEVDEKGNAKYPNISPVSTLYEKSPSKERINGPKDAFLAAAQALRLDIKTTDLTPQDVAAIHGKLRNAHEGADDAGWWGVPQKDLITAAIDDAKIFVAGEKSRIVTKFAGIFGPSRFGTFKEMVEKHGIHYYNSTHGIFDDTEDTDEYKVFRNIMIKLSESREEGFVELYHASMMSIALSKMNDNKRAEEETTNAVPAQGAPAADYSGD